jgi:UDP-N-acetylmuramoyl-L-alanyl-D-glutamate--2,6-diaminopimelate ligase
MLHRLKALVPEFILNIYHYGLAQLAAVIYGWPSEKMVVIGVTGTKGKSTTVRFIADILTELGEKVGYTSTAGFSIAGQEIENAMKMTMPGRFYLQALLRRMVKAGCKYAVIETSSQGIEQSRHLGINYDMAVFTNLSPEHVEAHGGFENYKKAKGKLFHHLTRKPHKKIDGQRVHKQSVINADSPHADYFGSFKADKHIRFGWQQSKTAGDLGVLAQELDADSRGANLLVNDLQVRLNLLAPFERENAVVAIAAVKSLGFALSDVVIAAEKLTNLPGRFEFITAGQPFAVIVDYAYEPASLEALFKAVKPLATERVIGVHGSAGGGRDVARRPLVGRLAAEHEDVVIVTNEDPYDEDPRLIIEQVAAGAREAGKVDNQNLFLIDDRQAAIDQAIALAAPGDVVLLTGKGSEPVIAVAGGKKLPWSDKQAALKALSRLGYNQQVSNHQV